MRHGTQCSIQRYEAGPSLCIQTQQIMLKQLSEQVAYCYQRARECVLHANRSTDEQTKMRYLEQERRWLALAHSYSFSERLETFNEEVKRRVAVLHPPEPQSLAVPRVMCPQCGKRMRLRKIEPAGEPPRRAEKSTFDCACGFVYDQTVDRVD
jgi:hypothetical protein